MVVLKALAPIYDLLLQTHVPVSDDLPGSLDPAGLDFSTLS
jgi:hypothetical protein